MEKQLIKSNTLVYLALVYSFILIGYSFNKGLFSSPFQIIFLSLAWLIFFFSQLSISKKFFNFSFDLKVYLLCCNLLSFILFFVFDGPIYISIQSNKNIFILKLVALILFSFYFWPFKFSGRNLFSFVYLHLKKRKFEYLIILAGILYLTTIFYSPKPNIDVYWFLDGGAKAIASGLNPYSQIFFNNYDPKDCQFNYGIPNCQNDNYSYLPLTIFTSFIAKLFFGDVRFFSVISIFAAAAILYFIIKKIYQYQQDVAQLIVLLILYLPLSLFVVEQAWSEPLSILLIYLFALFFLLEKKSLAYLFFGLFLGVKQVSLVFFAFILKLKGFTFKNFVLVFLILAAVILPFFIWSPADFINDAVIHHVLYKPPIHSLTFNTLSKIYFGRDLSSIIYLPPLIVLFGFLFFRKNKGDLAGLINSSLIFLFALFIIKQGFTNYYYSIICGIILLLTLELGRLKVNN